MLAILTEMCLRAFLALAAALTKAFLTFKSLALRTFLSAGRAYLSFFLRAANMPKDNIERAIKKSQGNIDNSYEFSRYEGFGPGRTGVIIEVLTDNKNRAVSNIRTIFQKFGGTLGETGSVSYQFEQIGQIKIKKDLMNANDALELAINAGAEDCVTTDFYHEINCKKEEFNFVRCNFSC